MSDLRERARRHIAREMWGPSYDERFRNWWFGNNRLGHPILPRKVRRAFPGGEPADSYPSEAAAMAALEGVVVGTWERPEPVDSPLLGEARAVIARKGWVPVLDEGDWVFEDLPEVVEGQRDHCQDDFGYDMPTRALAVVDLERAVVRILEALA